MPKRKRPEDLEKTGRKTIYSTAMDAKAKEFCLLNMTDEELALALDISTKTLYTYKKLHPTFLQAINEGKEVADAKVSASLYQRANGYEHDDVHVSNYQGKITLTKIKKKYPPDTAAAIFWLKNRRRKVGMPWSDKIEAELSGKVETDDATNLELARTVTFLLNQQIRK